MRILMACSQPEATGTQVNAATIGDELTARGHEVFIVSDRLHTPAAATHKTLQLDQRSLWRRLMCVAFLVRFIRKHRIQVVHACSKTTIWVHWCATRLAGVPMISTSDMAEPIRPTRQEIGGTDAHTRAVRENAGQNVMARCGVPANGIHGLPNGIPTGVAATGSLENRRVSDVGPWMQRRTLVVGSEQMLAEVLPHDRNTLACGVSSALGLVTEDNLEEYLVSNVDDSSRREGPFGRDFVKAELGSIVAPNGPPAAPVGKAWEDDGLHAVVNRLEHVYRSTYVSFFRREIPILCYHRLVESDAEGGKFATHIRVDLFEEQLRYLRDQGYQTLHFSDFKSALVFEKTQRAVILTFDDGYEDNYRLLLPLLKKYNAKAVIYLVSGLQTNDWDVTKGEKSLRLMNQSQRREMLASGLVEFGAHTVAHSDLSQVSSEQADHEIHQSKLELETSLGVAVNTFAYPYGRLNPQVKEHVRHAGFHFGIATDSGPLALHEDPFQVRRIVIVPSITMRRFARKVSGGYTFYRTTT